MAAAAASGMIYELAIATVSSYVLGDSVTHFSIVVGIFLFAMGCGAALSRRIISGLLVNFLIIELLLGFFGIIACPTLLYIGFVLDSTWLYFLSMIIFTGSIGIFVGIEIPIISRYLERFSGTRKALANVLAADYIGSLAGAVTFPLLLLPKLGLIGTAALAGVINILVAVAIVLPFRIDVKHQSRYIACCVVLLLSLLGIMAVRDSLFNMLEDKGYRDPVIYRDQSKYQRIVLTHGKRSANDKTTARLSYLPRRWKDDTRLFLDGHLQFSSIDEYRYHEALVHPAMARHRSPHKILILGGGDGLAAAEVLKYSEVLTLELVDLDARVVKLARENPILRKINHGALTDPRLKVHIDDAFTYIRRAKQRFDVIFADFPDPHTPKLSRLYSMEFYAMLRQRLKPGGIFVTQASSPFFARRAYWAIGESMQAAGFQVGSYHVDIPAFGDWGFHLGTSTPVNPNQIHLNIGTRFLTNALIPSLFLFGKDVGPVSVEPNTLTNMKVYAYYHEGDWEDY